MIVEVFCEICNPDQVRGKPLGKTDTDILAVPMTGAMFASPDPAHGWPAPFHPSLGWENLRCPMCRKRPFLSREMVKTRLGMFKIGGPLPGEARRVRPVWDDQDLALEWDARMAAKVDRVKAMKLLRDKDMSYAKIGERFGLTGERVRQLLRGEENG